MKDNQQQTVSKAVSLLNQLCFYGSAAAILLVIVCAVLRQWELFAFPEWFQKWLLPVLTSAAVGYLTNYIAIWLLFKPYKPLPLLFGLQGVIPKQQKKLAEKLGEEIPANLLPPEELADQIGVLLDEYLHDPELLESLRSRLILHIRHRRKEIFVPVGKYLAPAVKAAVEQAATADNLRSFYTGKARGFIQQHLAGERLAAFVLAELKNKTPELTQTIRNLVRSGTEEYVREQHPLLTSLVRADILASQVSEHLNWELISEKIRQSFDDPQIIGTVRQELSAMTAHLDAYMQSPAFDDDIVQLREMAAAEIAMRLDELLPAIAETLLKQEQTAEIMKNEVLPAVRSFLQNQLRRNREKIIAGLDLKGRIEKAVLDSKPEEMHKLINRVSEEHLTLLQILGFILGGIAGFLLVFAQ